MADGCALLQIVIKGRLIGNLLHDRVHGIQMEQSLAGFAEGIFNFCQRNWRMRLFRYLEPFKCFGPLLQSGGQSNLLQDFVLTLVYLFNRVPDHFNQDAVLHLLPGGQASQVFAADVLFQSAFGQMLVGVVAFS